MSGGKYDLILDGIRWSSSSVNSYHQCPKAFKLGYIDAAPRVDNAFSQWGSLIHSLLERYFKGKIEFFELSQLYRQEYDDKVKCSFPFAKMDASYRSRGEEFCDNFEGDFEGYEVVAVEKKVKLDIDGRPFVGVIDLVIKSEDGYIIVDHKSKASFKSKSEKEDYLKQLYLYSIYIQQEYGEPPKRLCFNMFRAGSKEWEDFDPEKQLRAREWFVNTIDQIYSDNSFEAHVDSFFCNNLCGVRHQCNCSESYAREE